MTESDLRQLQLERLQATANRVYRNVAFYRKVLDEAAIDVGKIRHVDDLQYLPFTSKDDLRKSYPYDAFAVPLKDIVRIHSTSGTTGKPIVVGYTKTDLNTWASLVGRVLTAAGVGNEDFVQIAFPYSLSTAGLGFHYGAEKIGASVVPSSSEAIRRQVLVMRDYKSTALVSTPGYALHLGNTLRDMGIHPDELDLRVGLLGAEPFSSAMRTTIEDALHICVYDNYGLTEIIGPGVAFECEHRDGLHVNEDHFIVEVIDPQTMKPVPPGSRGELVFTTITKQGFPLIRYRTGDISALKIGECSCGRTLVRMDRVTGRTDDMIIVEGVNVFPRQIEEALLSIEGIAPHYHIILDRESGQDLMTVQVEVPNNISVIDEGRRLREYRTRIEQQLTETLGFSPRVALVESKTIKRSTGGKMRRVTDNRAL
jgi:phenylacetate-CoA ligase